MYLPCLLLLHHTISSTMMQPSPSTPPGANNNGYRTRQRQRVGPEVPYRDDPVSTYYTNIVKGINMLLPSLSTTMSVAHTAAQTIAYFSQNAPLSSRLESFTNGGLGPSILYEKSKDLTLTRRCWNTASEACHCLCSSRHTVYDDALYYEDTFNDMSWACTVGTDDDSGIWMNRSDPAGSIMSMLVWLLILYSAITMTFLAQTSGIPLALSTTYCILASLALSCHLKTSLTDPGSVPASAVPTEAQRLLHSKLSMCSQCQSFKPPHSHHCRICNRCISRMDHHCPWMNNCVGAGNMKHFFLFLMYTWSSAVYCLLLLGWNYFFCASEACVFTTVLIQMVRIMTVLCVGAFLFVSNTDCGRFERETNTMFSISLVTVTLTSSPVSTTPRQVPC